MSNDNHSIVGDMIHFSGLVVGAASPGVGPQG